MPLAFAASLYEPYLAAKELFLVGGAAIVLLVWLATALELAYTALYWPIAGLAFLGLAASVRAVRSDTGLCLLAALVLFTVAVSELRDPAARGILAQFLTAIGTAEAVYVIWQALATDPLLPAGDLPGKWRAFGTIGNPNWTGEFLAIAILVAIGRLCQTFSRVGAVCLAVMLAGLGATLARGAWLACAVGCVAMLVVRPGTLERPLRITLALGSAAAAAIAAFLATRPDALRYLLNINSLRGRVWMWIVALRLSIEHPFGVGLGNFGLRFPAVQAGLFRSPWAAAFLPNGSFTTAAHNDYLQFIAEAGLLALIPIAALVWIVVRRGRKLSSDLVALGMWAAVIAIMADALFASPLYLPGTLAITVILLGASEAAVASACPLNVKWPARIAVSAAGLAICTAAFVWCYHMAASQFALQQVQVDLAKRRWVDAEFHARRAILHGPASMEAYAMLGRVLLARDNFAGADLAYARASQLGFDSINFIGRATALWHHGDRAAAIEQLEALVKLRPDLDRPRKWIAELRTETGSAP